jgi:hypothetical protein
MKKTREQRSLNLIADFVDGYAKDWHFAVGECFKDPLDIKLTERKESVIVDGKEKKITVRRWTQGRFYSFQRGYTIYDSPGGYLPWPEAFYHFKRMIQIIEALPNSLDEQNKLIQGHVKFDLFKPTSCRTKLETIGQYAMSQNDFIEYLRTGQKKSGEEDEWNPDL